MKTMQAAKLALRKEIKGKLKIMTEHEKQVESQIVVKKLCDNPNYKDSKRISIYLSMKNEVQTYDILKNAFENEKSVYIPKYVGSNMDMVKLNSLTDYHSLPVTSWNIKQPADDDNSREKACDTGGLDLIVVPGVAFTMTGDRLGHGKGYYDSYITKILKIKTPYLIGLAFAMQLCGKIPVNDHDVHLDEVITGTK